METDKMCMATLEKITWKIRGEYRRRVKEPCELKRRSPRLKRRRPSPQIAAQPEQPSEEQPEQPSEEPQAANTADQREGAKKNMKPK